MLSVFPGVQRRRRPRPGSTPGQDTSTLDDQVELAVTVYNSDIALVRDVRELQLPRGSFDLHFMDIAATVNPGDRALPLADRAVARRRARAELRVRPARARQAAAQIRRPRRHARPDAHRGRQRRNEEEVKARLLSYNNAPVWQIGNEIVTGLGADHIRFPELPGNLYSRPTLIWTLDNSGGAQHRVEASYLAGKLSWNADYVLTVARDDKTADLDGWVTLDNGSGTSFRNAKLQLVAGDLNRVRQVMARRWSSTCGDARPPAAAAPMAQEAFSDYHLYTLGRKTTINNNETKQVSMLGGTGVPVQKRYVVDGQAFYYRNAQHPGSPIKDVVQVFYQFKNEEKAGPRHADAGRRRARLSGRLEGRHAVRRRGPHRPHAEGRDVQPQDRQRLRRRLRAQADRLPEDRDQRLRGRVRDHAAQPQGDRRSPSK